MTGNADRTLVTLVTSIARADEAENLVEWVQHHASIGIEQFVVYNMLPHSFEELEIKLASYRVIFVDWSNERYFSGSEWKVDFITRFDKRIEWFSVMTVDQFLVLGDKQQKITHYLEFGKENRKRNIGQLVLPIIVHGPSGHISKPSKGKSVFENYPQQAAEVVHDLSQLSKTLDASIPRGSVVLNNLDLISNKEKCSFQACPTDKDPKSTFSSLKVTADKISVHRFLRSFEEWKEKSGAIDVIQSEYFATTQALETSNE